MKITAEFDSIMEVLEFADTFGSKKLGTSKVEDVELTVTEDVELTKPVQLHSPDVPPIATSVPAPKVTPVQTPPPVQPVQQPIVSQQTFTPPVQPQAPQQNIAPPIAPVPTTTQAYTMEQLAVAATQIVDAGHRNELVSLLASFGVQALTALPKEQYGAFATQLRGLGAKI
jgi:hypothetical protein